jgi:hypothetical protein
VGISANVHDSSVEAARVGVANAGAAVVGDRAERLVSALSDYYCVRIDGRREASAGAFTVTRSTLKVC